MEDRDEVIKRTLELTGLVDYLFPGFGEIEYMERDDDDQIDESLLQAIEWLEEGLSLLKKYSDEQEAEWERKYLEEEGDE